MPGANATCSSPISARIGAFMPRRLGLLLTVCLTISPASCANAACVDLKQKDRLSFQGRLNYRIFPGTPNYEDVRKGDTPEPTYILKLEEPICATGNEFVDPNTKFDRIQIFPESDKAAQALWRDLRGVYRATRPCCRHWSIRTPHRASPCASDAAHRQHFVRFRPDKIARHIHDHGARLLPGPWRRQR